MATWLPSQLAGAIASGATIAPPLLQPYLFYVRGVEANATHPLKQFGMHDHYQGLLFIATWAGLAALVLITQASRLATGATAPEMSHVALILFVQVIFMALMHPIYISLTATKH